MSEINLRALDLNLLVALDVLLEERHVSNSAERLNLTQSAMSHIFSRLRATFDDELLVRGQLGYEKTARAMAIESPLKEVLRHVKAVFQETSFQPETYEGTFNICTMGYGESIVIPQLMEVLSKEAPRSEIKIHQRTNETYEKILSKDIDVLFGAHFGQVKKNYCRQYLFEDRYVCVMHHTHPLADVEMTVEGFLKYPHSVIHPGIFTDNPIDIYLIEQGLERKVSKVGSNFFASILALKDSSLLQSMPKRMAATVIDAYGLVERELPFPVKSFQFGQVWHAKHDNYPAHKWFRGKIAQVCETFANKTI